jgi:hypothetical protein
MPSRQPIAPNEFLACLESICCAYRLPCDVLLACHDRCRNSVCCTQPFDAGFAILSFIGFLTVGLAFSIPVFLIVAGLVVVLQKFILNHLAAWAFTAPFLVAVIFLVTSDWLRPAEPQIWIYAVFAFIWSAVASPLFCFFVKRSRWI